MANIITPVARASYPNLFEPKLNSLSGKMEYTVDLLFDKKTDMSWLTKEIDRVIQEKWGTKAPKVLYKPIKDGDGTKPKTGEPYGDMYKGHYFVTLKTDRQPQIIDGKRQEIIDKNEIYGGVFLRASINVFAYERPTGSGVTIGLRNVQKVKDGEPFGAERTAAEDEFGEINLDADDPANYKKATSILG